MANLKSAKKRIRQNERRREINKRVAGRVRSTRSAFRTSLTESDEATQATAYASYCSALDKAVKLGVVNRNTAIRHKSRGANAMRNGPTQPAVAAAPKAAAEASPAADEASE